MPAAHRMIKYRYGTKNARRRQARDPVLLYILRAISVFFVTLLTKSQVISQYPVPLSSNLFAI